MSYAEFQQHYEEEGEREKALYASMSVEEIMERIKKKKYGLTYRIWYSLAEKATIEEVGWRLFDKLKSKEDFLTRNHCAAALLILYNPYPGILNAMKLSAEERCDVKRHLQELEAELIKRIGEKPKSITRRWWRRR